MEMDLISQQTEVLNKKYQQECRLEALRHASRIRKTDSENNLIEPTAEEIIASAQIIYKWLTQQ